MIGGSLIVAILLGNLYETHQRRGESEDRELFSAKLRCETLGEKYSADKPISAVSILRVDYSRTLHSCIALTQTHSAGENTDTYMVIDLITSDVYGGDLCKEGPDCNSHSDDILKKVQTTFNQTLAGKIKPLGR